MEDRERLLFAWAFAALVGCAPQAPPEDGGQPPGQLAQGDVEGVSERDPGDAGSSGEMSRRRESTSAADRSAGSNPEVPSGSFAVLSGYTFERVLDEPVRSLALGNAPRIAVLADEPWMFEKDAFKKIPVAARYQKAEGQEERVEIFFGRDNQPRLMGYRHDKGQADDVAKYSSVYLRHKRTGWEKEPSELGQLGSPAGALYGILGEADPEVVCRPGVTCLIKRVSGWKNSPADAAPVLIEMQAGEVFKVVEQNLFRLEGATWTSAGTAPAGEVTSVWGTQDGVRFVIASGALYERVGSEWKKDARLPGAVAKLAGPSEDDLWVVGDAGACKRQGESWACAADETGALRVVAVRDGDVFLGGEHGLWVGRRKD